MRSLFSLALLILPFVVVSSVELDSQEKGELSLSVAHKQELEHNTFMEEGLVTGEVEVPEDEQEDEEEQGTIKAEMLEDNEEEESFGGEIEDPEEEDMNEDEEEESFALFMMGDLEEEDYQAMQAEKRNLRSTVSYTKYSGKACRTSSGSTGSQGYHYYKYSYKYSSSCRSKCDKDPSCKGYEYSYNRCEIWKYEPQKFERIGSSIDCYVKKTYSAPKPTNDVYFRGRDKSYCRTSSGYKGDNGDEYDYYKGWDWDTCRAKCVSYSWCKGYEYRGGYHCELWKVTPRKYEYHGNTGGCYVKYYY